MRFLSLFIAVGVLAGCAEVSVPDARNVHIPNPIAAEKRKEAVNERPDSVMYLPLGEDVLMPMRMVGQDLPKDVVGPFELRSETLAGALQLILADYDISIAFETDQGLTKKVTVANLKGPLDKVVSRVCSLADLYCSYEDGTLVIKDTQTFTVSLPPLGDAEGGQEFIGDVIAGLTAVIGGSGTAPVSDPTTRTLIYSATQRTSKLAENYFQRLRANTAMIVFETYIWEVSLNAGNSTGIDWDKMKSFGKFNTSIGVSGSVAADFTNPISIGLPTTQAIGANPTDLIEFLSQFGAVKTISQPQITVLSGSSAELRVADTENYVSEVSSTISGDNTTTSVSTDSVDSGFTLNIGSSWDKSTVYANVNINLTNVDDIEDFAFDTDAGGGQTTIQLPQTTERELTTQIRVRPGDSVLIAGLVRERDNFDSRGPGFMEPILPDSRTAQASNLELVILLRPRVIVYTASGDSNHQKFLDNRAERMLKSSVARRAAALPALEPEPEIYQPPVAPSSVAPVSKPLPVAPKPLIQPVAQPAAQPVVLPEPVVDVNDALPLPSSVVAPVSAPEVELKPIPKVDPLPPVAEVVPVSPVYQKSVDIAPRSVSQVVDVVPPVAVEKPLPVVQPEVSLDVSGAYEETPVYPRVESSYQDDSSYVQDYTPSQSSGYVPGYVSGRVSEAARAYASSPVVEAPVVEEAPIYEETPPVSVYPSSVYDDVETYQPSNVPLSADVYNNAQPLNVYEVYERSKASQ